MTPDAIVRRMVATGFLFSHAPDGGASFRRPVAESAEVNELLGQLAWRWDELEPVVLEYLAVTKAPAIPLSAARELRAAG